MVGNGGCDSSELDDSFNVNDARDLRGRESNHGGGDDAHGVLQF